MSQIDPLQDALEALRAQRLALPHDLSQRLHVEAPAFYDALENVIMLGGTAHVEPPPLQPGDRRPEELRAENIFVDADFDVEPPRHLKDVWEGRGDHDDPFVPVAPDEGFTNRAAVEHDEDLIARRMRADSDANLRVQSIVIGSDDRPMTVTDRDMQPVTGPWNDVDWAAKADREKGVDTSGSWG